MKLIPSGEILRKSSFLITFWWLFQTVGKLCKHLSKSSFQRNYIKTTVMLENEKSYKWSITNKKHVLTSFFQSDVSLKTQNPQLKKNVGQTHAWYGTINIKCYHIVFNNRFIAHIILNSSTTKISGHLIWCWPYTWYAILVEHLISATFGSALVEQR